MKEHFLQFLSNRKYEVLLTALIAHLYIGIVLQDLEFYTNVIWPLNMIVIGVASSGVFIEKGRWKNMIKNIMFITVLLLPIGHPFLGHFSHYMTILSLIYCLYFVFILVEIIKFLIRPGYINFDIISASACGYFLLIEIGVFLMQAIFYHSPDAFSNIKDTQPANIYIDLVYFCSIIITSIGFGDITPNSHYTKLIVSLFGVIGQFYSVVLIGILISKFTSEQKKS
ncbi:MAG: Ion transport 2 domain protein [Thalassobius sp.]|nr:Ion transport 2 domain protein [Thalassovita sp.]